tara:strand:+ start:3366 stop:6230 length:2865 start_codon:yes stop_codon:yes gene_type:complete
MNNKDLYNDVYRTSLRKLKSQKNKNYKLEDVKEIVRITIDYLEIKLDDFSDFDICCQKLLDNLIITTEDSAIINDDSDHIDWYDTNIDRPYWETHREWLLNDYPIEVVNTIDRTTDEILKKIENPNRLGSWDRRGLVVGSVQSGKTGHFIALINKAVDAGYKRIIVLSGLTNDLRMQTNQRLDEGFFGYNTEFLQDDRSKIGDMSRRDLLDLGLIRGGQSNLRPITLTNSGIKGDLSSVVARQGNVMNVDHPMLFCVKKNKTSLQNILQLFLTLNQIEFNQNPFKIIDEKKPPYLKNSPILIIDDEVDQASVDTGNQIFDSNDNPDPEYNPKTINRLIRQILNIHSKKIYIGYTATPISNIFIHDNASTPEFGEDLFPKSFIYDLPLPSNYFGIDKMFPILENGDVDYKFIKLIQDHCLEPNNLICTDGWIPPKHNKEHIPLYNNENIISDSLREAIYSFLIVSTLRNLRGGKADHKSMLIHVSKYILVNKQIFRQVSKEMDMIRSIFKNPGDPSHSVAIFKFKILYDQLRKTGMDNEISFEELLVHKDGLSNVANEASKNIKNLSGDSDDILDYKRYKAIEQKGIITIIIGGDRLSRGITLEGLSTSYFLRSSRMYDTLMQMGRWFGYRDGYEDLIRLYTTVELSENFEHISKAMDELRIEFRAMANYGKTPMDFGLKVKSHPYLMVTSNVKRRHGTEISLNFIDHSAQTVSFDLNKLNSNLLTTNKLIDSINEPDEYDHIKRENLFNAKNSYLWKNIESTKIINFFEDYSTHKDSITVNTDLLANFIKKMNNHGELMNWTVSLMGTGNSNYIYNFLGKYKVELLKRAPRILEDNKFSIGALSDPTHEAIDLNADQIKEVINISEQNKYLRSACRKFRDKKNGLLILYPVYTCYKKDDYNNLKKGLDADINFDGIPTIGFAVSFPSSSNVAPEDANVKYVVNNIYYNDEYSNN